MEMNNFPNCAPFLDHKRDTTVGAEGLSIAHTCHGIHPSEDYYRIRQDPGQMIANSRTSRTVNQESRLEVLTNLLGLANARLEVLKGLAKYLFGLRDLSRQKQLLP